MQPKLIVSIAAGAICLLCLFIAYEQYQSNADTVAAMNQLGGGMLKSMTGGSELEAGTPAATKYALFFAVLSGAAAVTAFVRHRNDQAATPPSEGV
jgi:hypothetical protein